MNYDVSVFSNCQRSGPEVAETIFVAVIQSHRRNSVLDDGMGGGRSDEHAVINPEDNRETEARAAPHLPFRLLSEGSLPGVTS